MGAVAVDGLWQAYRVRTRRGGRRRGAHTWALQDVDLHAGPGEVVGLIGTNGSGKSTLLRSVAGILVPTRGSCRTTGRTAALVDLTAGLARDLTGRENVLMSGVLLGMSRAEVRARYDEIAAFAGLAPEVLAAPLDTYSSGMVLRLGMGLLVACRPEVLCVDEVLAVGDEGFQAQCLQALDDLRAGGACIVIASHDAVLVEERCTTVHVLERGKVVFHGDPTEAVGHYHRSMADP